VTTMRVVEALDAGPVYLERRVAIGEAETAGELSARLAILGGSLLVETLSGLEGGRLSAHPQEGEPSFCRPIRREDAEVDWQRSAGDLVRRLRAFTPWPGLYTHLGGERVKILDADVSPASESLAPGTFTFEGDALVAAAGDGTALRIRRLQRAGRKPVTGPEFARAVRLPGRFGLQR